MIVLAVAVVGSHSFQAIHTFFIRLPETAGASDAQTSTIRTVFWVVAGLAAPAVGWLMDRHGSRRTYAASLLGCAVLPLLFLPTGSVLWAATTLGLFGVFLTGIRTSSFGLAAELAPVASRGRHFAVYNGVGALGWGVAGLLVGGPVADLLLGRGWSERDAYGATFVVGSALTGIGLVLFVALVRAGKTSVEGEGES
jgi:MFS family permease